MKPTNRQLHIPVALLAAIVTAFIAAPVFAAQGEDAAASSQAGTSKERPADKLDLPGASIIGNQELPVGLDIVPWRPAAAGNVKDGPTQLLDEPLEPVDPEIFRHQLQIYSDTKH